jgi:hypothetical protein
MQRNMPFLQHASHKKVSGQLLGTLVFLPGKEALVITE